jgi:Haem-binding domain
MRIFIVASLLGIALFAVTLTGRAPQPEPPPQGKPLFQGAQIDGQTRALFQRACQNCHSENVQWPWYSRIPPASWMVRQDVDDARGHVNFSNWNSYGPDEQEDLLTRISSVARSAGCR